jgi:dTDP-4-amino-4,6-dideoxygalactose transaminase
MQAAILRLKLPHLDRWNALRRQHAYAYNRLIAQTPAIECPAEFSSEGTAVPTAITAATDLPVHHVYHQYTISADNRDKILARLVEQKIGCAVYYPLPLHLQKANADLQLPRGCFPVAERTANRCLSLPMFPELRIDQLQHVVDRVNEIVSAIGPSALAA